MLVHSELIQKKIPVVRGKGGTRHLKTGFKQKGYIPFCFCDFLGMDFSTCNPMYLAAIESH